MFNLVTYIIMVPMVYLAFGILLAGSAWAIIRIIRSPKQTTTLKIFPESGSAVADTFFMPDIRRQKPLFWLMLMLYHIAFALLILGHLDLIPAVKVMDPESNHMVGYGSVGVVLTLSVIYFFFRRLKNPVRQISTFGDYLLLLLLLFLFLSGDMMSWSNSWNENGFVLDKAAFGEYMNILAGFTFDNPRDVLEGSHYIVVVIHVFLANLFLMIFPFTKFVHIFFALAVSRLRRG